MFRRPEYLALGATLILSGCSSGNETALSGSARDALQSFHIAEGFDIELVAAEPLISDPVAMEVDPQGNIFVVEMHGYPLDLKKSGVIKLLTDTDGNGSPDKSYVFADSLILPNGIMAWKNGVIVTDPPDVLYLEDTDGDHRADKREVLLTGFSLSNPQHNANSPVFGLDNWIYIAHEGEITPKLYATQFGDTGSAIRFPQKPGSPALPRNAGGKSIRFQPDTHKLEMLSGESQFGHTFSPYGDHIGTSNADHLFHEVLAARYLLRNPASQIGYATQDLPDHGNACEVFPVTRNPQHQLLTDVGVITSSCGVTWYGGGLFPGKFNDVTFVAEPVHNLVHADVVKPAGASFTASRLLADREFLASTDPWFRPVNFYNGPDGALYVIDYHRQIIEHPEWMSEEVVNSGELYNGSDMGRIYRIVPSGSAKLDWCGNLSLNDAPLEELVSRLSDPAIWWRKHAQRLLFHRNDEKTLPTVRRLLQSTDAPLAWVHGLWLLEGLGALDKDLLVKAFKHPEPGVRVNAIQIAERYIDDDPLLQGELNELRHDVDPKVRYQLLCTLGSLSGSDAAEARFDLLKKDFSDPWVHLAAFSSMPGHEAELVGKGIVAFGSDESAEGERFFRTAAAVVGRSADPASIKMVLGKATSSQDDGAWWKAALLQGLNEGLGDSQTTNPEVAMFYDALFGLFKPGSDASLRTSAVALLGRVDASEKQRSYASSAARKYLGDHDDDLRADAMRVLLLNPQPDLLQVASPLIDPSQPDEVQLLAIRLANQSDASASAVMLCKKWSSLTPPLRKAALEGMLRTSDATKIFLGFLHRNEIRPSTVAWPQAVALMNHHDDDIRKQSREFLNTNKVDETELLSKFASSLEGSGSHESGEQVFEKHCSVCHQVNQQSGTAFGPDLATIRNRDSRFIVLDILNPDRSIADGFDLWSVQRKNGGDLVGIVTNQMASSITLRLHNGSEVIIPRNEIAKMEAMTNSGMPGGFDETISTAEMQDLIAFLKK